MITILSPDQEFNYEPISGSIKQELTKRESDKNRMIGRVPFVRLTCLQKVTYTNETNPNKQDYIQEAIDKQQQENKQVDGFVLELGGNFDETYGTRQVIGKDLRRNSKVYVPNPRRVPPPRLTSFTAQNGENAGFYTTANLQLTANSKEQLEFLTPFLLHPGNTVFVEFGYSDKNTTMNEELFSSSDLDAFVLSLDVNVKKNDSEITLEEFYKKQQQKVEDNEGNFEFVVGVIHNFDFKLNSDFGFDINIDLWSISKTRMGAPDKTNETTNDNFEYSIDNEYQFRQMVALEYAGIETKQLQETAFGDSVNFSLPTFNTTQSDATSVATQQPRNANISQNQTEPSKHNVINLTTKNGQKKYIRFGKILEWLNRNSGDSLIKTAKVNTNPFIKSNTDDVIWFHRKSISYKNVPFSLNTGEYILDKTTVDEMLNTAERLSDELIDYGSVNYTGGRRENGQPLYGVGFESFRPYFFDDSDVGKTGDINNIYIEVENFIRTYTGNKYNINNTLKKILNNIQDASGGIWELTPVSTEDSVTVVSFSSGNVLEEDRKKTYTFKFNQKQSIVNEVTFDLKLEGIIGDQIYFESINQTDSNTSSTKLNLLLFEKHENGIEIYDYRNKKLEELKKSNNLKGKSEQKRDNSETLLTDEQLVDRIYKIQSQQNIPILSINKSLSIKTAEQLINLVKGKFIFPKDDDNNGIVDEGGGTKTQIDEIINEYTSISTTIQPRFEPNNVALKILGFIPSQNNKNSDEDKTPKLGGVNPLLESIVDITMPGLGGFRPLTFFNTDGLPDVYDKRGDFCIMNVVHTLTPTSWTTSINSRFRIRDKQ